MSDPGVIEGTFINPILLPITCLIRGDDRPGQ